MILCKLYLLLDHIKIPLTEEEGEGGSDNSNDHCLPQMTNPLDLVYISSLTSETFTYCFMIQNI